LKEQCDVLVVSPHPDDAEFGVSGTVVRWVREGKRVVYVVCTRGDKGTSDRSIKPADLARTRQNEQLAAAELLGVAEVVFLGWPDQGLEDTAEFRKQIVRQIRIFRPTTVVTADPYRRYVWHRDHRIAGRVVLDAVFPYARDHLAYPDLLAEGLEPHKVKEVLCWASEDVNLRLDVTDTFEIKMAALHCHKSQIEPLIGTEFETWLRQRYRDNAEGEEFEYAEAFHRVELPP
jgi:LmbE family N-acetylglucosaminyl deacetylase